jgi:hypothetical protein
VYCGPVRRRGLADDAVVVAIAADTRVVRLTIDDVIDHDGQVFIRLSDPAPGPRTFAATLAELAANRDHEHRRQPRLPVAVPNGHAGQPLTLALVQQFRAPGAAATQTRTAAFR